MKKIIKKLIYTSLIIIGILALLISPFIISHVYEHSWVNENSPDNSWELIMKYKEFVSYIDHKIIIYYKKSDNFKKEKLAEVMIPTEGTPLGDYSYDIKWINNNSLEIEFFGTQGRKGGKYLIDITAEEKFKEIE